MLRMRRDERRRSGPLLHIIDNMYRDHADASHEYGARPPVIIAGVSGPSCAGMNAADLTLSNYFRDQLRQWTAVPLLRAEAALASMPACRLAAP